MGLWIFFLAVSSARMIWKERAERPYWSGAMLAMLCWTCEGLVVTLADARTATRLGLLCVAGMLVGVLIIWWQDRAVRPSPTLPQ